MLDELLYVFLRALEFDGDDPLPLIMEWNCAIARVQAVFDRMTDKDAKLVPVVRCRECIYWEPASPTRTSGNCNRSFDIPAWANDFCSYGKRKDGGPDDV